MKTKDTAYQNLSDAVQEVLRRKIISINIDIVEQKKFHINDFNIHFKNQKKIQLNTMKEGKGNYKSKNHLNKIQKKINIEITTA